jgi:hypothetical protein
MVDLIELGRKHAGQGPGTDDEPVPRQFETSRDLPGRETVTANRAVATSLPPLRRET